MSVRGNHWAEGSLRDKILQALKISGTITQLAIRTGATYTAVANILLALKKEGLATRTGNGAGLSPFIYSKVIPPENTEPKPKVEQREGAEMVAQKINRDLVLKALEMPGTIIQLEDRSGLACRTIADILQVLMDEGLVTEGPHPILASLNYTLVEGAG